MKTLYLVGGTMGVGKTTVCQKLKEMLPNSVFLDGDWCWDASPFVVTRETKEMVMDNICHLLGNFLRSSQYQNIVFCWVMNQQSIIDEILHNLDTEECRVICISLTAEGETLRQRLAADIEKGIRRADIIERSLERMPLYSELSTIKIATDRKNPYMIAEEIMKL